MRESKEVSALSGLRGIPTSFSIHSIRNGS